MNKRILDSSQTKTIAKAAIQYLAQPVKRTLGPGGNPIIIQRKGTYPDGTPLSPLVTKDGVTVAENVSFKDPALDTIAKTIIQVAQKTVSEGGDGPQPLYSKVLTPRGFVEMKDIKVGMEVCGTDGTIQTVLGVFPKGKKELFEVEFSSGQVVECCPDHLWTVTESNNYTVKTVTTEKMLQDFKKFKTNGDVAYKYYTPSTAVEFYSDKREMPLDPYLVGLLLGGGSLSGSGSIEISIGLDKEYILDKIVLPEGLNLNVQKVDSKNYFRIKFSGKDQNGNTAKRIVESIGLLGSKSSNKFIPKSYLYSSLEDRKALLQGLVDTDGYTNSRGLIEFSSVSKELSEDFETLLRSLGKDVYRRVHTKEKDLNSYSDTPIYRVCELKGYKHGHKIVDIRPTGKSVEMQCIKVSNDNHLYITNDFIVTHNTTTSVVLAEAIYNAGIKFVEQGENNIQLYSELQEITEEVISTIDSLKVPVKSDDAIFNIAEISSNGDKEVAQIVVDAIKASGEDGYVALEEGSGRETHLEVVEGAVYKATGWRSFAANGSLLVTDKSRNVAEYDNAAVCIYGGKLDDVHKVADFINKFMQFDEKRGELTRINPIVFVALDYSDDVKQMIIKQKELAKLPVAAVKIGGDGSPNHKTQMLHDLAAITGAAVGARSLLEFEEIEDEHLGYVEKITIEPDQTVFYEGGGDKKDIMHRIEELNTLLNTTTLSKFDASNVRLRKAKLSGGVAIVRVGGDSELEMVEKKDRIEDALCAAKVAIKDGVVEGGGTTLLKIAAKMPANTPAQRIMRQALQEPFKQIIRNTGVLPEVIMLQLESSTKGYDARNKTFVNMFEAGIIDPAVVTKSALRNAVSIAGLLLTTGGALVADTAGELQDGDANPLAALFGGQ